MVLTFSPWELLKFWDLPFIELPSERPVKSVVVERNYPGLPTIPILVNLDSFPPRFSIHTIFEGIEVSEAHEMHLLRFLNLVNLSIDFGVFALMENKLCYINSGQSFRMEEPELYFRNVLNPALQVAPLLYPLFVEITANLPLNNSTEKIYLQFFKRAWKEITYILPEYMPELSKDPKFQAWREKDVRRAVLESMFIKKKE